MDGYLMGKWMSGWIDEGMDGRGVGGSLGRWRKGGSNKELTLLCAYFTPGVRLRAHIFSFTNTLKVTPSWPILHLRELREVRCLGSQVSFIG